MVKSDDSVGGDQGNIPPHRAVDGVPTVWELRESGVAVKDVELAREENNDQGKRHQEKTHEAGFRESRAV